MWRTARKLSQTRFDSENYKCPAVRLASNIRRFEARLFFPSGYVRRLADGVVAERQRWLTCVGAGRQPPWADELIWLRFAKTASPPLNAHYFQVVRFKRITRNKCKIHNTLFSCAGQASG